MAVLIGVGPEPGWAKTPHPLAPTSLSETAVEQLPPTATIKPPPPPPPVRKVAVVGGLRRKFVANPQIKKLAVEAAVAHALPVAYFLRLTQQESGFDAHAVSSAGAQGISQFMPETAAQRGLKDPFDPKEALPKSAEYLNELRRRFGNLGLAAAAYNAGSNRVTNWLAGRGRLPLETIRYVRAITGHSAEDWLGHNVTLASALRDLQAKSDPKRPVNWELALLLSLQAGGSAAVPATYPQAGKHPPLATKTKSVIGCDSCIVQATY